KFLMKMMPKLPQALLYKGLRKNCVKINGKHIKDGSYKIIKGEILTLYFNDEFFDSDKDSLDFISSVPNLNIIYEDKNILLIDKPQGICVHQDTNRDKNNLLNCVKSYLYKKGEYNPSLENTFAPAFANRIDKGTGGIVIAAKNAESLRIINEKIKNREIEKKYLCLAYGKFAEKEGKISGYILRDTALKTVSFSDTPKNDSKKALTLYKVLEEFSEHSLVEVELKTGRTHQIRASFAHIGHPILGDRKYGSREINIKYDFAYQALYSYKIRFNFSSDAGNLDYLNGKEFEVPNVSFAKK
ncbi:MAG: RluA family pseudouridine synthase, partial [Bacillota bacterium]|nr:RluA family pseudouridine synthase [Bacillota bacterium]